MNRKRNVGHAFSDHIFEERVRRKRGMSASSFNEYFRLLPFVILCLVFALLSMRLFTLQIVRSSYYARLSDANRIRTELIPAPRGIIFDRNGNALVRNTPAFGILQNNKFVWLDQNDALKRVSRGEQVYSTVKRDYVYKDIFAHVIGYVGQVSSDELLQPDFADYGLSDFTGRMGLEQEYEKFLHGENGKQLYEVNAKGEKIRLLGEQEARQGAQVHTTLDANIQKTAVESMAKIEKGAVVVTDPRDGSVMALYSKPTFDPNLFTRDPSYQPSGDYKTKEDVLLDDQNFPLLDRAIAGGYPPGSTFKIVTSIAALSSHSINEDTQFDDKGTISVGGSTFGTWYYLEYGRTEGLIDVRRAIVRSNDIFFYNAGMKTGIDMLSSWAHQVGLGEISGIDLPGEIKGIVPNPAWKEKEIGEQWYLGDTVNTSIGQGFLEVTPMQVNRYTQIIANGGELYRPHLLMGDVKIEKKDFIPKEYLGVIKDGMKGACEPGGTGYPLFNFAVKSSHLKIDDLDYIANASAGANMVGVTLGCKTGTSEDGLVAHPHAWFTVFAPFYNPEIAITVLAENAGQGSDIAAPVAKNILKAYFEKK